MFKKVTRKNIQTLVWTLDGLPGAPGTFRPFDLLATRAVRFGAPNTVSVKITNDRLAELGVGGILAPVMFWSPHNPDWRP